MIEQMKRLSFILREESRDEFLSRLQGLGVYHIEGVEPVSGDAVLALEERLKALGACKATLEKYRPKGRSAKYAEARSRGETAQSDLPGGPDAFVKEVEDLRVTLERSTIGAESLRKDAETLSYWGEFDPKLLAELERNRVQTLFCSCSRSAFEGLDPGGLFLERVSQTRGSVYFVVVRKKNEATSAEEDAVLAMQQEIPRKSLSALRADLASFEEAIRTSTEALAAKSVFIGSIEREIVHCEDLRALETAKLRPRPEADGAVLVLSGYVPEPAMESVLEFLKDQEAVYLVEEPQREEKVPVKLRLNPFARLFEPILRMFSLPDYWELDTTPFFAPFYAVFFGLSVADVGYGALLLVAAVAAFFLIGKGPMRRIVVLGIVLSASVLVAGLLLDDYFGVREGSRQIAAASGSGGGTVGIAGELAIFRPLSAEEAQATGGSVYQNPMLLPLALGVVQVLFGWFLRIRNQTRHYGWQGFGQATGNILFLVGALFWAFPSFPSMLGPGFHIGPLPIGLWLCVFPPSVGLAILALGVLLILFFNNPEKKLLLRPALGLWSLYELITGLVGDVLSYLRLFALGLAGGLLAEAVNGIATSIVKGATGILPYVFMIFVLLLGHALNLGIGLLSAFVHSLRLQFVEFYKAVEFKGGGLEYDPLRIRKRS